MTGLAGTLKTRLRQYPAMFSAMRRVYWAIQRSLAAVSALGDILYDWRRYVRWAHDGGSRLRTQRERALIKAYHGVEKGLSLQEPRPGFGKDKIVGLMRHVDEWVAAYGVTGPAVQAIDALRSYRDFNAGHEITLPGLSSWLDTIDRTEPREGGTRALTREAVRADVAAGGHAFFASRHSIRSFGTDRVPDDDIRKAVDMARKTPSVCNRQGARVHVFDDVETALKWQPGNRGFGHLASHGLVVTCDLQAFSGRGERNQVWIDGGLFAMSLMYAFHALGHGACPLAWSTSAAHDKATRAALNIPDNEAIIMMIAVGTLPETFNVAASHRNPIDDYLIEH